jgi:hypothetical protein
MTERKHAPADPSDRVDGSAAITACRNILDAAEARTARLRALGGVGVALTCPSARRPPLQRAYADIDVITTSKDAHLVGDVLVSLGFAPEERFNQLHGHSRMLFDGPDWHIDMLIGRFVMCHDLDLRRRLTAWPDTLAPADLLLTKLQVAKLNRKDLLDIVALLLDHELTDDDRGISVSRVASVLAGQWGWWRTATFTLERVKAEIADIPLAEIDATAVRTKLNEIELATERAPKGPRWRARARIGTRMLWYHDPEEIAG